MGARCCRFGICGDYTSLEVEAIAVKLYSQRQSILDEIVNSEIAYVKQLQRLDEHFIQPLSREAEKNCTSDPHLARQQAAPFVTDAEIGFANDD